MQFMQTLKKSNFFQDFFQKQRLLKVTTLTYKGTNVKDFPITLLTMTFFLVGLVIRYVNNNYYYSTIASFHHIWSRERAKYETVIHCSVPV